RAPLDLPSAVSFSWTLQWTVECATADLAGPLLDPVRTGERLGAHPRLESARAALRGNPRHERTAVHALPSEIGRGDHLRSALVSRRRPAPAVDGRFRLAEAADETVHRIG